MESTESLLKSVGNRVRKIVDEGDELRGKIEQARHEISSLSVVTLNEFMERRLQFTQRVLDLHISSKGAWNEIKIGAEITWNDMCDTVENAADRFRESKRAS